MATIAVMGGDIGTPPEEHLYASKEFLTGFYSVWSDVAGCLDCAFCSCCFVGRQRAALEDRAESVSWPTCACACPLVTFPCIALSLRRQAKAKYQLREGGGTTFVIGCLLWPLSLCQVTRELGLRDVDSGGTCCKTTPSMW